MPAYFVGVAVIASGGDIILSPAVNVPVGDLLVVYTARSVSWDTTPGQPVPYYGHVTDSQGNEYFNISEGEYFGDPIPNTASGGVASADWNQQIGFVDKELVAGTDALHFIAAPTGIACAGSIAVAIGISLGQFGSWTPPTDFPVGPGDFAPIFTDTWTGLQNTTIAAVVWDSTVIPNTHTPVDDGYTLMSLEFIGGITFSIVAIAGGPGPPPDSNWQWSANVDFVTSSTWFFQPTPTNIIIGLTPDSAMQAIACKRGWCVYPWFG